MVYYGHAHKEVKKMMLSKFNKITDLCTIRKKKKTRCHYCRICVSSGNINCLTDRRV